VILAQLAREAKSPTARLHAATPSTSESCAQFQKTVNRQSSKTARRAMTSLFSIRYLRFTIHDSRFTIHA
jgi:hypothetical protein